MGLTRKVTASRMPTLRSEDPYASRVPSSLSGEAFTSALRKWESLLELDRAPDVESRDRFLADRARLQELPRARIPETDESLLRPRWRFPDATRWGCIDDGVQVRGSRATSKPGGEVCKCRADWLIAHEKQIPDLAARKEQASSRLRTGRSMTCSGSGTVEESATLVGQMQSLSANVPAS